MVRVAPYILQALEKLRSGPGLRHHTSNIIPSTAS
jgi:hypothetical protein